MIFTLKAFVGKLHRTHCAIKFSFEFKARRHSAERQIEGVRFDGEKQTKQENTVLYNIY